MTLTQPGEVLLLLLLCAVGVDGMHDEGRLNAHDGAISAVHSLHLSGDQTVRNITHTGTSKTFTSNTGRGITSGYWKQTDTSPEPTQDTIIHLGHYESVFILVLFSPSASVGILYSLLFS